MPIYEYECQQGHRFEKRQSFHDEPLRECIECRQPARRLLSPAGIIFKGSGWYITDSRAAAGKSGAASGESSASSTTSDGAASEAAKSATTSEKKSEAKSGAAA